MRPARSEPATRRQRPAGTRSRAVHRLIAGFVLVWLASAGAGNAQEEPVAQQALLHLLIPGGAGGGWDRTARGVGQALSESGLVDTVRYENMSGGGGGKAIAHLIEVNRAHMLMVNSTAIVIRSLKGVFPQSFRDLTPIASVIGDYAVIVVRKRSPHQTLNQLLIAQRAKPRSVPIAGGSVSGGMDHLVAMLITRNAGGDPRSVKYIPYDTGGKAMAGLLSGETLALSSGYSEVVDLERQGWVRILCIAAAERLPVAPHAPTCNEAGAPGAVFVNWRGFFAAPGMAPEQAAVHRDLLAAMYQTDGWGAIRDRNGWVETFFPGAAFTAMMTEQEIVLGELMRELGLL